MAPSKKLVDESEASTDSLSKVSQITKKKPKILTTKIKRRKHRCKDCSKIFQDVSKLRLHKMQCKLLQSRNLDTKTRKLVNKKNCDEDFSLKVSLLPCEQCPKKFKFEARLLQHIVQEHSRAPNSVECDQCSVRCPDIASLKEHVDASHDRSLYQCQYCKKTFVRAYHVQRHLKQKGCSGETVNTMECEICNTSFKRKDNLLVHLRGHLTAKSYMCRSCSYETHNFSRYSSHVMKKHMPKHFECHYCGKVNSSRAAISKHLEIHGEKKYACEVCGYRTHTIEVIRRHVLRHTSDKPYKCELCSASFIQILQLRRHLEKHMGNQCNVCGKDFKTKAGKITHERTHLGLEELHCPYEGCMYVKKSFATDAALEEHCKMHESKRFLCEVCSKSFHNSVNLKRHMSTHTLERPRRCMYCVVARAYIRGEALVRHVRMRHPTIFQEHLVHVRQVMGYDSEDRVKKTETESILNLLDAISDRIHEQNKSGNVLYGGMQEIEETKLVQKEEPKPKPALLSEAELEESLRKLMIQLIDAQTLEVFGWPNKSVDVVLEKVLEQCGTKPADRKRWSRVQRLRENAKHLFLQVIEDKTTSRMLETHTIDQVIMHILEVSEGQDDESDQDNIEDVEEKEDEGDEATDETEQTDEGSQLEIQDEETVEYGERNEECDNEREDNVDEIEPGGSLQDEAVEIGSSAAKDHSLEYSDVKLEVDEKKVVLQPI